MLPVATYSLQQHYGIETPHWEHYFALPDETIGTVQNAFSSLHTDFVPDSLWNRYIRKKRYFYNLFIGKKGISLAILDRNDGHRITMKTLLFDDSRFCEKIRELPVFKRWGWDMLDAYYDDLDTRIASGKEAVLIILPYRIEVSRRKFIVYDKKGDIVTDRFCGMRYNSEVRRLVLNPNAKKRIWLDTDRHQGLVCFFESYPVFKGCEEERSLSTQWTLAVMGLVITYLSIPLVWLAVSLFIFSVIFKKFSLLGALIATIATIIIWGLVVEWMKDRWV